MLIAGFFRNKHIQLTKTNQIQVLGRLEYWELVMQALNLDGRACPAGSISGSISTNLALEMVARGLGCVVAPKSLARIYMDRGLLVEPLPMSVPSQWTYCVHAVQKNATPAIRQFR
jgi:DNA-binding transcriptional LysR family regulator